MTTFNISQHPSLFSQDVWDSGALTGISAVTHQVSTPGTLTASLMAGGSVRSSLPLHVVAPRIDLGPASPALGSPMVHVGNAAGAAPLLPTLLGPAVIDVAQSVSPAGHPAPLSIVAPAQGYIQVLATIPQNDRTGIGPGYGLTLAAAPGSGMDSEEWDSRKLGGGDVFTVTLARPGRYQATNQVNGRTMDLTVDYPRPADTPRSLPSPLQVTVEAKGMAENGAHIQSFQGINFVCRTPARIVLRLVAPQDTSPYPAPPAPKVAKPAPWLPQKASWRKPA